MRIGDASRNETLHSVDVLAVEHFEYVGVVSDPRHFIVPHISGVGVDALRRTKPGARRRRLQVWARRSGWTVKLVEVEPFRRLASRDCNGMLVRWTTWQ